MLRYFSGKHKNMQFFLFYLIFITQFYARTRKRHRKMVTNIDKKMLGHLPCAKLLLADQL